MDDFEKDFPNFDWRETSGKEHPKNCRCPKHEYVEEIISTTGLPLTIRLCPPHYKVYWETEGIMMKEMTWFQRKFYKFMMKLKWIIVKELKYMESEICFWCKFGSGGREIKPLAPIP